MNGWIMRLGGRVLYESLGERKRREIGARTQSVILGLLILLGENVRAETSEMGEEPVFEVQTGSGLVGGHFSPDGTALAYQEIIENMPVIRVIRLGNEEELTEPIIGGLLSTDNTFFHSGKRLLIARLNPNSIEFELGVLDLNTGVFQASDTLPANPETFELLGDQSVVTSSFGNIYRFDSVHSQRAWVSKIDEVTDLQECLDGTLAIRQAGDLLLLDSRSGFAIGELEQTYGGDFKNCSEGGSRVLIVSEDITALLEYRLPGPELVMSYPFDRRVLGIASLRINPQETMAAFGTELGDILLQPLNAGEAPLELGLHRGPVWRMAFSPSGKYLATGASDRSVKIWDMTSLELVWEVEMSDTIEYLEFSSSAKHLLALDVSGLLKVWKLSWEPLSKSVKD